MRLVGVSIYNLSEGDAGQTVMREILEDTTQQQAELQQMLLNLHQRYGLDSRLCGSRLFVRRL